LNPRNILLIKPESNENIGKSIQFDQSQVKAKRGIGRSIEIDYFAHVNKRNPSKEINYNFRVFKPDQFLMENDQKEYCLKQVTKMCFYVSKLYNYEILRLRCTFVVDDDGLIWFSNVHQ
jgi:uncharacterized protein YmfQ (DUF2313 family)